MVSFLAVLPQLLVTSLFLLTALLRLHATPTQPTSLAVRISHRLESPVSQRHWFPCLISALKWNAGYRSQYREAKARELEVRRDRAAAEER
jgi:hypothetical protein